MSEQICDNTSVGVIVHNNRGELLLIDRARFPFGLAAPAGHIDDHGSQEEAAITEVWEETGLQIPITGLACVIKDRHVDNRCRRPQGDYHVWTVFTARSDGLLVPSPDETKSAGWYSKEQLKVIADNTLKNKLGHVFEPIWLRFLVELDYI